MEKKFLSKIVLEDVRGFNLIYSFDAIILQNDSVLAR